MLIAAIPIFFLSGFCALVYQVIWQRMLVIFSGADVQSATIVVAAFMAGLGCGSFAGGHIADRLSRNASLTLFGLAEIGIALFGGQSAFVLYDLLYQRLGHLAGNPLLMAAILFLSLLWPTFLMGMSLPLLAKSLTRDTAAASRTIGWLYAANTLGAAIGALATTWWLIPYRGLEESLQTAAFLNVLCAAGALPLAAIVYVRARGNGLAGDSTPSPLDQHSPEASSGFSFGAWCGLYALSGFIALSLEIVWFRLLGVMLKATAFTFGTLLAQHLFWLGLGAALGSLGATRARRPGMWFLSLQTLAGLYVGLSLALIIGRLDEIEAFAGLYTYFNQYEPLSMRGSAAAIRSFNNAVIWSTPRIEDLPWDFFWLYFALPAALVGPPTLLMGLSFPFLQAVVQTDLDRVGRRVGVLLLSNILASTVGTIVTGWLLLGWLGTAGTFKVLVAASGTFAVVAITYARLGRLAGRVGYAVVVLGLTGLVVAMPDARITWGRVHGTHPDDLLIGEDQSGLSALKGAAIGDFSQAVVVYVNGLGQSRVPYGGTHTILGALPAFLHPNPRDAAIIGLGSGDTLFGAAGRRELTRITSIEIVKPQIDTLHALARLRPYAGLLTVLRDPRIEHVFGDGRAFLKHSSRTFDILEADALRPDSAFAGNLYSEEYFALLRAHLKPGGLAVTWAPTGRVERTFVKVFPHAIRFPNALVGSNEPIPFDRDAITARFSDPAVRHYYQQSGIDIVGVLSNQLENIEVYAPDPERLKDEDTNTDLMPRDEFEIPAMFDWSLLRPEGSR